MSASAKILVVDDTPNNVMLLEDMLTARGYQVTTAVNGEEALGKMAAEAPDLVLLDIMMPKMNGYQVLEHVRADARLRQIPVIMISAVDDIDSVIRCIELGAEDYLPKPFKPTLLRARVGASIEKKRLRDEIVQHVERIEKDLEFARAIQLSMVPTNFPAPTAEYPLAVHAALHPAREIGGDLYDCFWIAPGRMCLVVADVSDKGASAALFMARTKTTIRLLGTQIAKISGHIPSPAELVEGINAELCRDNPHAMFVTLFLCMVDAASGDLHWCSAGHPLPYRVAPQGGVTAVAHRESEPVGLRAGLTCAAERIRLAPGETLFVYTDGITEATNERGEFFGEERLEAALRSFADRAPGELVSAVLREVRTFAGASPAADDIAALACRWRP
jgi:sigma-B regulation protein RsbU (phosphoserine phosphatase)